MNLGKWEIPFWMPPSAWCLNWGYYPNARDKEFFFVNLLFIEIRHFGAFNKKKVCKKCGQNMPKSNRIDKEV